MAAVDGAEPSAVPFNHGPSPEPVAVGAAQVAQYVIVLVKTIAEVVSTVVV